MPLKISTWHKAVIGRLRDPKRIQYLLLTICETDKKLSSVDKHLRLVYPSDYDQENDDAKEMFDKIYDENILYIFENVANKLFFIDKGKLSLRLHYLSDFNILTTSLDTYAFFATELLKQSEILYDHKQQISYLVANIDESYRFEGNIEKRLSTIVDLHVHAGAILDFSYRIHNIVSNHDHITNKHSHNEFEPFLYLYPSISTPIFFHSFSLLESFLFHVCTAPEQTANHIRTMIKLLTYLFDTHANTPYVLSQIQKEKELFPSPRIYNKHFSIAGCDNFTKELFHQIVKFFNPSSSLFEPKYGDRLLIILFLHTMKKYSNEQKIRHLFNIYFIMRNIIKTQIFQQHRRIGFGYFSSYSRHFLKKQSKSKDNLDFIIQTLKHPELHSKYELRINIPHKPYSIKKFYQQIEEQNTKQEKNITLKFIHHYLKNYPDKITEDICRHEKARSIYKKQTLTLIDFLNNKQYRFIESNNKHIDLAHKYFQGIDAASFEHKVPPEVFAASYLFFKKSILSSGLALQNICNPHQIHSLSYQYSFHVGEEFRDIMSGLRHIVEAVYFLDLKNEDRLGHAVALAIDPKMFKEERKKVSMSKGEYLDNLIFIYYILQQSQAHPFNLQNIKSQIDTLIFDIYASVIENDDFNIDDFIDAWLLRRNCPMHLEFLIQSLSIESLNPYWELKKRLNSNQILTSLFSKGFHLEYTRHSIPDFLEENHHISEPSYRYKTAQKNPKAYQLFRYYAVKKQIRESYFNLYNHEIFFRNVCYMYMQDYIMQHIIAKRDLVVEILPTSNVLITPINNFNKHPFLRLNPPKKIKPNKFNIRKNKIKIVLGTDDPGIQGTNFLMELNHLQYIVETQYGKDIAQQYIESLISFSNYIFDKS